MAQYTAEYKKVYPTLYSLMLTYKVMPAHSEDVLADLKAEIAHFSPTSQGDILANAWFCPDEETEDTIELPDGSTSLVFRRSDSAIITMAEHSGETKDTEETDEYFAIISAQKTAAGIKPENEWLTISILLKHPTSAPRLYELIIEMFSKWTVCGQELHGYVHYGDKENRLSWQQIRDTDGAFVHAHWDPSTGFVSRMGVELARLDP